MGTTPSPDYIAVRGELFRRDHGPLAVQIAATHENLKDAGPVSAWITKEELEVIRTTLIKAQAEIKALDKPQPMHRYLQQLIDACESSIALITNRLGIRDLNWQEATSHWPAPTPNLPTLRLEGEGYVYKGANIDGFADHPEYDQATRLAIAQMCEAQAPETLSASQVILLDSADPPAPSLLLQNQADQEVALEITLSSNPLSIESREETYQILFDTLGLDPEAKVALTLLLQTRDDEITKLKSQLSEKDRSFAHLQSEAGFPGSPHEGW